MNGYIFSTMAAAAVFLTAGASAPPSAPFEPPLQMTMSEILKDPWRYDGKLVRVRGTFDECHMYTCQFCERAQESSHEDDDDGACMGVNFYSESQVLEPASTEEHLADMRDRADDLAEQYARFTTATLEAQYYAACSHVQKPGETGDMIICMDRASQLRKARVVQVHIRRSATAGHVNMYYHDVLVPAGPEEAEKLRAAFKAASSGFTPADELVPDYIFLWKDQPDFLAEHGLEAAGGACLCRLDDCTAIQWPSRFGDITFDIPANPYKCWDAERRNGVWKFPLQ